MVDFKTICRSAIVLPTLTVMTALTPGCGEKEKFPDIGLNLAGPVDLATSDDGNYFYVLNTDPDRKYDKGSILVLKNEEATATKVKALPIRRLARSLVVSGNRMLVGFDRLETDGKGRIELYDVSNPEDPQLKKTWDEDCIPVNFAVRPNYQHFAVTCGNSGRLFIGTFADDLAATELKHVRDYIITRRAVYIDPKRELLFAFPTDLAQQSTADWLLTDQKSYDPNTGQATDGANEIPDDFEDSPQDRERRYAQRYTYQFVVYDIASQRDAGFPFKELTETPDGEADRELRYTYFNLDSADGKPDADKACVRDRSCKYYRTNFWAAKPDPLNDRSFYLSHRGGKDSPHANNVLRVTIEGDLTPDAGQPVPATGDVLSFKRVYGYNGEVDDLHFPGDFTAQFVDSRPMLVVNHFRSPFYWDKDKWRFSIAAKVIDEHGPGFWHSELKSTEKSASYFQIAMNAKGRAATLSYYGNSVILLDVKPGTDIKVVDQIH